MTITHQATTVDGDTVGRASASFSHDSGAGSDRGLFVCVKIRDNANAGASAVTYNSVGLAKALDQDNQFSGGNWANLEWWYLANPASGSNTLAVTYDNTLTADEITAITLNGVDQADPIGASGGATGNGTAQGVTFSTEEDNSWALVGIAARRNSASGYAPGTDTVELADGETGTAANADIGYFDGYEGVAAAGSVTAGATYATSTDWTAGAIEVKEAGGVARRLLYWRCIIGNCEG